MRTPLNSISGLIDLLQDQLHSDNEYLENLKSTSNHLKAIINDVLDLSKAEAGKLELQNEPFDLKKLIQTSTLGLKVLAESKNLNFDLNLDRLTHPVFVGDSVRLNQVIYNLVGNSIKFTNKGNVSFTICELDTYEDRSKLNFEIADTGMGMSPEDIQRILEPYAQANGQGQSKIEGTGLGMGIAIQLIDMMGGKLVIASELGLGTLMSFDLNLKFAPEERVVEHKDAPNLDGQKALIVEDDMLSRNILKEFLRPTQLTLLETDHLDELSQLLNEHTFNWIISDLNIEGGSTLPLFSEYSGNLIFVSGDAVDVKSHYPNAHFLLKPIERESLYKMLLMPQEELSTSSEPNLDNLLKASNGDSELMQILIDAIKDSLPDELNRLRCAVNEGDRQSVKSILHKLKPSIAYLGDEELMEMRSAIHDRAQTASPQKIEIESFISRIEVQLSVLLNYSQK